MWIAGSVDRPPADAAVRRYSVDAVKETPTRAGVLYQKFAASLAALLLPLASLRITRHTGVQERRERVTNRLQDLSPGLGDFAPEKRITWSVFSSRESAARLAIQGAVGIL
jgi:hypothetical protein